VKPEVREHIVIEGAKMALSLLLLAVSLVKLNCADDTIWASASSYSLAPQKPSGEVSIVDPHAALLLVSPSDEAADPPVALLPSPGEVADPPPADTPTILGMPDPINIYMLCQNFPTPDDFVDFGLYWDVMAFYPSPFSNLSLVVPPEAGPIQFVSIVIKTPTLPTYPYSELTNGTGLFYSELRLTNISKLRCSAPLSDGTTITLVADYWYYGNYKPVEVDFYQLPSAPINSTVPLEAFEYCIKKVGFQITDMRRPFKMEMSLVVTLYGPDKTLIVNASTPLTALDVGCDGVHTHATSLTTAAAPGSVDSVNPFLSFADEGCADSSTVPVMPDLLIPVADPHDFLYDYNLDCKRTGDSDAPNLLGMRECVVAVQNTFSYAIPPTAYPVYLTGRSMTIADMPTEIGPVDVTWTTIFPGTDTYMICKATSSFGYAYTQIAITDPTGGRRPISLLRGPSPAWVVEACLRSLTNGPRGMLDGLGTFALNLTANSRLAVTAAPVFRPFEVRHPCPPAGPDADKQSLPFSDYPLATSLSDSIKVKWPANCPAIMANASRSFSPWVERAMSTLIAQQAPSTMAVVSSASVAYRCSNCIFRGQRVFPGSVYL
jgi:hypothetical protein